MACICILSARRRLSDCCTCCKYKHEVQFRCPRSENPVRQAQSHNKKTVDTNTMTSSFADATSPLRYIKPFIQEDGPPRGNVDPARLSSASTDNQKLLDWQPSIELPSLSPIWVTGPENLSNNSPLESPPSPTTLGQSSFAQARTRDSITAAKATLLAQPGTPESIIIDFANSTSPGESGKSRKAHHAANQRTSKARKGLEDIHQDKSTGGAGTCQDKIKQRRRDKNKVAAAKCRSRQRIRGQAMQEKATHLGDMNAELETMVQKLRGELSNLRYMALDHQECNCDVAQYNTMQAKKIAENQYSSYPG
jgi:hypothetical protein